MTDERMKELMAQVGYPHSHSIAQLICQVENETAQKWQKATAQRCAEIAQEYGHYVGKACAEDIRKEFGI